MPTTQMQNPFSTIEAAIAKLAKTAPSSETEITSVRQAQAKFEQKAAERADRTTKGREATAARIRERRKMLTDIRAELDALAEVLDTLETDHQDAHDARNSALDQHDQEVRTLFAHKLAVL